MLIVSNIRSLFRGLTLNSICKWESEHTETDTHTQPDKEANRKKEKDKWINGQTDELTDRQTD